MICCVFPTFGHGIVAASKASENQVEGKQAAPERSCLAGSWFRSGLPIGPPENGGSGGDSPVFDRQDIESRERLLTALAGEELHEGKDVRQHEQGHRARNDSGSRWSPF